MEALYSLTAVHRRHCRPVVDVSWSDLLLLQTQSSVLLELNVLLVDSSHFLLVGDDVVVVAAVTGGLSVESQVMAVCHCERSQPAAKRNILVAIESKMSVKSSDDAHNVSPQDVPSTHGVGEVVWANGPVLLCPASGSFRHRVTNEIAPVEVVRTSQVSQSSVQRRDTNVRIVVCLYQEVKVQVSVGPD